MTFDTETAIRLIAESLKLVDRLGASPINVRGVRMADRTLVIDTFVSTVDPMAVRGEIAGVMGALSGLDVVTLFPVLDVQSFGVRAFDSNDQELLWIVSSVGAARFAAEGRPIEWLANSWVQENTPAYRRAQADRMIGHIETALRDLLDHHARQHVGATYPAQLWSSAMLSEMRDGARREGHTGNDPLTLLGYVYLPQLRDAIVGHIDWLDDRCVPDLGVLSDALVRLNRVRRKVAHHRPISEDDLRASREVARAVLGPVGQVHPEFAEDFLVDRWEEQVAEIFADAIHAVRSPAAPGSGTLSERGRRAAGVGALETQLDGIAVAATKIKGLIVPEQRSELQEAAVAAVAGWRDALQHLVEVARRPGLTPAEAEAAHASYEVALSVVRQLSARIQELRVGLSPDDALESRD